MIVCTVYIQYNTTFKLRRNYNTRIRSFSQLSHLGYHTLKI